MIHDSRMLACHGLALAPHPTCRPPPLAAPGARVDTTGVMSYEYVQTTLGWTTALHTAASYNARCPGKVIPGHVMGELHYPHTMMALCRAPSEMPSRPHSLKRTIFTATSRLRHLHKHRLVLLQPVQSTLHALGYDRTQQRPCPSAHLPRYTLPDAPCPMSSSRLSLSSPPPNRLPLMACTSLCGSQVPVQ